jgi:hypothetical protein
LVGSGGRRWHFGKPQLSTEVAAVASGLGLLAAPKPGKFSGIIFNCLHTSSDR